MDPDLTPPTYLKVYRFQLVINVEAVPREAIVLPASAMRWEGDDLVLLAGMVEGRRSLYERLRPYGHRQTVEVRMFDAFDKVARRWSVTYTAVRNRGFVYVDSSSASIAIEQVVLKDCQLHTIVEST